MKTVWDLLFETPYTTALFWDSRHQMYFSSAKSKKSHFLVLVDFLQFFQCSDLVIAKCRMLNWEKWEMGKIYDLLFVRVCQNYYLWEFVKMCSVSSFDTKEIKLDSINSRALECPVDKSDVGNLQWRKPTRTWLKKKNQNPLRCG